VTLDILKEMTGTNVALNRIYFFGGQKVVPDARVKNQVSVPGRVKGRPLYFNLRIFTCNVIDTPALTSH